MRQEKSVAREIWPCKDGFVSFALRGGPARVPGPYFCAFTISVRLSEPTHNSTVMMTKPIETSYDTICAADLREPRKGYFELEAQPPMMMP